MYHVQRKCIECVCKFQVLRQCFTQKKFKVINNSNEIGRHSAMQERGSEKVFFSLPNNSACA